MSLNVVGSKQQQQQQQRPSLLDKTMSRGRNEVSATAFALLFSEMVQYSHNRVSSVNELHEKWVLFIVYLILLFFLYFPVCYQGSYVTFVTSC